MKNNQGAGIANKPATTTVPTTAAAAAPTTAKGAKIDTDALRALTEKLAYELWEKHGKKPGNEMADWLEAEKLARAKLGA